MKRWLPWLAALMLFTGCAGQAAPSVLAVFAAEPEERLTLLTDPADLDCWDALALDEVAAEEPTGDAVTIGGESWLAVPATLRGTPYTLWLRAMPDDSWQLDLAASFGLNRIPAAEWDRQGGLFTVRVTASLLEELPAGYEQYAGIRFPLLLRDADGEEKIAVAPRDTEDGEALLQLLSDGKEHRLLLRLRAMQGGEEPILRVAACCGEGWLDQEAILRAQCGELLAAVRSGRAETAAALLTEQNISVTDENGDGLLYLALLSGDADTVSLLADRDCPAENRNYYRIDGALTEEEQADREALLDSIRQKGRSPGCIAGSIVYQLTASGNADALGLYLDYYPCDWEIPAGEDAILTAYYGGGADPTAANLLDIAVTANDAATARVLLSHGAPASGLLRQALRQNPVSFSRGMLAVLGEHRCFGELDDVLADYAAFKESYEQEAGNACTRFEKLYNDYMDAAANGDYFQAAAVMDSGLLKTIVGQLTAVKQVQEPQTDAIGSLWDLMYEYADMMDTAGWYYKRIARSTYSVTRNYQKYMFELRLSQGEKLYNEFITATATYDWLLENIG